MGSARYHLALAGLALLVIPVAIIAFNWAGEDCFITYRYAENLADGHGPVFNPTDDSREDRVEGYSNPTMVLLLAGVHHLGGNVIFASRWIAIFAAMGTVYLLGCMALQLGGERRLRRWALIAPALFALQPIIHYQIGRALEATLITFFLVLAAHLFTQRRMMWTSLALGLVAWSRPEAFLYLAPFIAAWGIWIWRENDPNSNSYLSWLITPFAGMVAILFVWRFSYYGHWLPNSVTLKTTPGVFGSSLHLVRDFVISWSFLPALIPLVFAGMRHLKVRQKGIIIISTLIIAHQLSFIIAVGNVPASAFRHFVPLIPFACLLIGEVVSRFVHATSNKVVRAYAIIAVIGLSMFTVSNGDATRSRLHVRLKEFVLNYGGGINNPFKQIAFHWRWFHTEPFRVDAEAGRWVAENIPFDALIAGDQMGQFAYYARQPMLDMIGLMDETIAQNIGDGLDVDYIFARDPECVVFIWPAYGDDYTPDQWELRADPRFDERYRLRWRLVQDLTWLDMNEFHIFVRRDGRLDDGLEPETVLLPGDEAMSHTYWRI